MGSGYDRHAATYDHDTGHFNDFRERAVACVPQLDGGFWDTPGQCVQVSGSRLAFRRLKP
jgi:hypothetical protein